VSDDNIVYVSSKEIRSYVGAVLHNLSEEGSDNEVCHLVSRGQYNSKTLDCAEIVRRDQDHISIENIELSTEWFEDEEGEEQSDRATNLRVKLKRKD